MEPRPFLVDYKSKLEEMALKENVPFQLTQLFKEHLFLIILIPLLKNKTKNSTWYTPPIFP